MGDHCSEAAPASSDKTWGHKWGFADTCFLIKEDGSVLLTGNRYNLSGYKMYGFLPYVEDVLGVKIDWTDRRQEVIKKPVTPPYRNKDFCLAVESHFNPPQYTFEDAERLLHSHGQASADEVSKVIYSRLQRMVDMVFFCESQENAGKIIQLAKEYDVCLVPFGGGTSVSSALKLPLSEHRMIVSVDMKRMNRVEWIDKENLRACVQAGITGMELEQELEKEGFLCGHEPDSVELSTLGGWIATNASGMKKNRYGNIEQIVEKIIMVTPQGLLEQKVATPRSSMGMQPQYLLFGSEGNLGLIVKALIKIHPIPEVKKYGSLIFPNMDLGLQFLYQLAHGGFLPASIRLVDNLQFHFGQALNPTTKGLQALTQKLKKFYLLTLRGFDPHQIVAATIVMEGSHLEVAFQEKNIYALSKQFKGLPAGAESGQRGYMLTYGIAYIRDFLADFHIIGETFETSVPWNRISKVCQKVQQTMQQWHKEFNLPGKPYLSYRITQVYHTGVCIYFMLGIYAGGIQRPEEVFTEIEHSLRRVIIQNGGSISHHHGVGKIRKDFMPDTLSPATIELLKNMKQSSDPQNIFGIRNNIFAD